MEERIVEIIHRYEGELAKLNQELQLVKEELQAIRSSKELSSKSIIEQTAKEIKVELRT